jgi:hypothetical protein
VRPRYICLLTLLLPLLSPTPPARADDRTCEPTPSELGDIEELIDALLGPSPGESLAVCEDTCGPRGEPGKWANDGMCDDGGPGATNAECPPGSDCTDCGVRGCDQDHPCGEGQTCVDGGCEFELGDPPTTLPSDLPGLGIESGGDPDDLLPFTPVRGRGYENYPENGETWDDQYRSYVRRDLRALVKYASARVEFMSRGWDFGNGAPLGLGDMSEADGSIPGTRERDPGHPRGSHLNGQDMDIAYYQLTTMDNHLRPVCEHRDPKGSELSRCVSPPDNLDVYRTALFLAYLHDSDSLRIIGVDGQIGPLIEEAWERLCDEGWLSGDHPVCTGEDRLTYETTDRGYGWYRHHHHHFHVSTFGGSGEPDPDDRHNHHPGCMHQSGGPTAMSPAAKE